MRKLILLPLMLAACQQQPAETAAANDTTAATQPAGYSDLQQRLLDLGQDQRYAVFLRAIRDGNAPCQGVVEATRQEDQNGNPVFTARCTDGPIYAIAIDPTGTAQVTRLSPERR